MSIFSKRELMRILEIAEEPCLSIYLPTHRMGSETQQDSIRLKNLLSEAGAQLRSNTTLSPEEVANRLKTGWALVNNYEFWQSQAKGLALFFTGEHTLMYRVPISFEERVVVSSQFYIRPLLPLLNSSQYYILAASQNDVRFFSANRDRIEQIEIEGLTSSLAEALQYDDPEKQQQFHQTDSPIYHGQGSGKDQSKVNILRFFQKVTGDIETYLNEFSAPLIFVGVNYLFPIYQEANTYSYLHEEAVTANPDRMHENEIHKLTWPIAEPIFKRPAREAVKDYYDRIQTRQTTSGLLEILSAAHNGQIDTLLISKDQEVFGQFNAKSRQIELHQDFYETSEELLNLAAVYTLFCGGTVYSINSEDLPSSQTAAAILRHPSPVTA